MRLSIIRSQILLAVIAVLAVAALVFQTIQRAEAVADVREHVRLLRAAERELVGFQELLGRGAVLSANYQEELLESAPEALNDLAGSSARTFPDAGIAGAIADTSAVASEWRAAHARDAPEARQKLLAARLYIYLVRTGRMISDALAARETMLARANDRSNRGLLAIGGVLLAALLASVGLTIAAVLGPLRRIEADGRRQSGGADSPNWILRNELTDAFDRLRALTRRVAEAHAHSLEREARLRQAERIARIGSWYHDEPGGRFTWSDGLRDIVGLDAGRIDEAADQYLAFVAPDDRPRVRAARAAALAGGAPLEIEYRLDRSDESRRDIVERGEVVRDGAGVVTALRGAVLDVTALKRALAEVADLQARFETLVRSASTGILVHREFRPIFANDRAAQIFGYDSPEEIVALADSRTLYDRSEWSRLVDYNASRLKGDEAPAEYEVRGVRKDGQAVNVETRAFTLTWDGAPAVCATLIDVTDRNRAQAEARERLAQLAHIDRVTTLGEMAASLVHEIAQPVTAISNAAGAGTRFLDFDTPDLAEAKAAFDNVSAQTARLRDIIERIRAYSKQGEAANPHEYEPADLADVVTEVLSFTETQIEKANVALRIDLPENGAERIAGIGRVQLSQVLANLIGNAAQAMTAAGTVEPAIAVVATRRADGWIAISVSDNGPGVPEALRERIFEPFYSTKADGMGLGLSVCTGIVDQVGGRITVEAVAGGGTDFSVLLPPRGQGENDERDG